MKVDAGAIKDATTAFDRALAITTGAGASWDAARLRRRLRRLGVRRRFTRVERQSTGWGALTAAEFAVADLAAEGRTNREIAERLFRLAYVGPATAAVGYCLKGSAVTARAVDALLLG